MQARTFPAPPPGLEPHFQEAEDGHSEEMSTLRDAREELKSQLKAAKAQANENSSIAQVCAPTLSYTRTAAVGRR